MPSPFRHDQTSTTDRSSRPLRRRSILAGGAGIGAALVAGCTAAGDELLGDVGGDDSAERRTGSFRLLVSDQPNAIGDFSELNVTFDHARVIRIPDETDDGTSAEGAENATTEAVANATTAEHASVGDVPANATSAENATAAAANAERGVVKIDLEGETADLTELIGEKATEIADVPLAAGRYASIHLEVASVEGIASEDYDPTDGPGNAGGRRPAHPNAADEDEADDGEATDDELPTLPVKLPSERLRINRPFEIAADERLEFVFDINVIRRGDGEYVLAPVIGESGVVGRDVEADVIDDETPPGRM